MKKTALLLQGCFSYIIGTVKAWSAVYAASKDSAEIYIAIIPIAESPIRIAMIAATIRTILGILLLPLINQPPPEGGG